MAVFVAALMLFAAPAASASDQMLAVIQDDNQFIYGNDTTRDGGLDAAKAVGADAVRVTVLWEAVAAHSKRRRIRRAHRPSSYPPGQWDRYDELVKSATRRGMRVYFNITPPGPRWAHERAPRRYRKYQHEWMPKRVEYGRFVRAVGSRYDGTYRDENGDRGILPRVSWWSGPNEGNQGGWLAPQALKVRGVRGVVPMSPHIYRELLIAFLDGMRRSGHRNDIVLWGELAPLGRKPRPVTRPIYPGEFLREVFCLDRRLRRYRGRASRARDCSSVRKLRVMRRFPNLALGHHPYTRRLKPTKRFKGRDSLSMANLSTLTRLLDRIARRSRAFKRRMPVYLTEFGYETNPPDTLHGISLQLQAAYQNLGDYLAYRNPRIMSQTHFQLLDVPPDSSERVGSRGYWRTYQSGLFFQNLTPKPSAFAYAMPFEISRRSGRSHTVWGQLRAAPNGQPQQVQLQFRVPGGGAYQNAGAPINVTNHFGYYEQTRDIPAGTTIWRAVWNRGSEQIISREVEVR